MKSLYKKLIITTIILVALVAVLCACKTNKCKDGHTWELTSTTATCYDGGVETHKCKKCKTTKNEEVEAYGHDYVLSSRTEPTCKTNGEEVKKCSRCGFESKQTLLMIDHDYQVKSTIPSTCTVNGSQTYKCIDCDSYYSEDTIISVENSVKYTKSISYTTCAIRSARFKYAWRKSTSKLYPYGSDTRRLIRHCKHIPTPSNWTKVRFCVAIYPKKRKFPYIGRNIKKFCS